MTLLQRCIPLLLAFASAVISGPAAAANTTDAVLMVDSASGVAGVQRNGKRLPLNSGDVLQEQDTLVTATGGRITLRLGRHGFVEVGPDSEVGIERLPFAAYARDLKSIFSVGKGYFRVVWKHPQISTTWPLYIYMAGHRISLVSGEYFFQNYGTSEQRACVAAGQLALQVSGFDGVETIKAPSCTRLVAGTPPATEARNPDDWIAVRRAFSIEATAIAMQQPPDTPAAAVPAPPPKPVIRTAALPNFATTEPVPIAPPASPLSGLPEYLGGDAARESSAERVPGPVVPAPVIATPQAVRPAVVASVSDDPPLAISPPLAAPTARTPPAVSAPIIASSNTPPMPPLPSLGSSKATKPPLAAPAPSAAPVPPLVAGSGVWALNIASYSDSAPAGELAQKLKAAGYAATTAPAMVNGRTWYRVQVPGFGSEPAARATANEIQGKLGLKGIWIVRPS